LPDPGQHRVIAMAKGQMRSTKEKKKPKADRNKKRKGGPVPSATTSSQPQIGLGNSGAKKN
jgi:hypothetical protein